MEPISLVAASTITAIAKKIVQGSLEDLGKKYSVDVKYVLRDTVKEEFRKCLDVATTAFLQFITREFISKEKHKESDARRIIEYLKSASVTEEIWHLLDPGSEFFDKGKLTQLAIEQLPDLFDKSNAKLIYNAWEEFLKAFSFASRSAPEFREFLRASYEAGSFKALSNIEDVLETMNGAINNLKDEELMASKAIEQYAEELKEYRNWAASFQMS